MRAGNSHHLITATRRRAAAIRKRAVTALRHMDTTGTPTTIDAVAKQARSPGPGSTTSPASEPRSNGSAPDTAPRRQAEPFPTRQRASDASLLCRLESAAERIKRLETENQQLREALALALGKQRAATVLGSARDTPRKKSASIIGPC